MNATPVISSPRNQISIPCTPPGCYTLTRADASDREVIYRLRHEIFARELAQHGVNPAGRLRDALDDWNHYLVVRVKGEIAGFISITPPTAPTFSLDKYWSRSQLPFPCDQRTYEVRLLTVLPGHRRSELAALLMYAAFRWVESHGGSRIIGMGRREILDLYLRVGLERAGLSVQSGAVTYEVVQATLTTLRESMRKFAGLLQRLESHTDWQLGMPFHRPAQCFHGGAFFEAIGPCFDNVAKHREIINADVLDAWFPPAPTVVEALREQLPWLLHTSPPTACEGLVQVIASARGVEPDNILPGGGSSDLIFRALRQWLTPRSHALILDPTYGEYAHVLEKVIGCTVDRFPLLPDEDYEVNLERLEVALADRYDLVVLVNPNSPTGRHVSREALTGLLRRAPAGTRFWVDETYVEYAGPGQSLEDFAACSENVIVCKSMSKVYALSGARVAYLCAGPHQLEELRATTPPWVVSLPGQIAAVRALQAPGYYAERYGETDALRKQLADALELLGLRTTPGIANFILCQLPSTAPEAATVVKRCRAQGLFLRDASVMGSQLDNRFLRIAVKDAPTNERIVAILEDALRLA